MHGLSRGQAYVVALLSPATGIPLAAAVKFSTNHEGISQLAMKMGDWLHYCFGSLDL